MHCMANFTAVSESDKMWEVIADDFIDGLARDGVIVGRERNDLIK